MKPEKEPKEDLVSRALNEHGFLFQSRLAQLFGPKGLWKLVATEVPVAAPLTDQETRIDLLIERAGDMVGYPWQGVIEAKRSHPDYKYWVFFDESPRLAAHPDAQLFIQSTALVSRDQDGYTRRTKRVMWLPKQNGLRTFNYYLEAKENFSGKGTRSATNSTIEDALNQVTLGAIGLADKMELLKQDFARFVPIIVTTANIYSANYGKDDVSLDRGELAAAKLKLEELPWVCVNYALGDRLANAAQLTTNIAGSLPTDVGVRSLRSVFIVQSTKLLAFLQWFNEELVDRNPT